MRRMLAALIALLSSAAHADEPTEVVERYNSAITSQNWERAMEQVRTADVANLRAVVMKSMSGPHSPNLQVCFGDASLEDIAKMSDAAVSSCMFKSAFSPSAGMSIQSHTMIILGSVTEDPDTRHYVVKNQMTVAGRSTWRMDVITAVHEGGVWRVKLPQTTAAPSKPASGFSPPLPPPPPPPQKW
jgi:hypothetical protein